MLKQRLEADLKEAMLKGDKPLVSSLRLLKSAIGYAEVAQGKRDVGLSDDEVVAVLTKERRKRLESAAMYQQHNQIERADQETREAELTAKYLPASLSDDQVQLLIEEIISQLGASSPADFGKIMTAVKGKAPTVDMSLVASLVKQKLTPPA